MPLGLKRARATVQRHIGPYRTYIDDIISHSMVWDDNSKRIHAFFGKTTTGKTLNHAQCQGQIQSINTKVEAFEKVPFSTNKKDFVKIFLMKWPPSLICCPK